MGTYGGSCSAKGNLVQVATRTIITHHTIGETGNLTSFCIYVDTAGTFKLKVFRNDGTNWIYVGQSNAYTLNPGINSGLSCNIAVQNGDYIGIQADSSTFAKTTYDSGSSTWYFKQEDVISNSTIASWSTWSSMGAISLTVSVSPITLDNVYVNSSIGNDTNAGDSCVTGHPVLTFTQAYTLLNLGGTIYICNDGADFSGETVTFTKPYNIAQGAAGVSNCKLPRFN